MTLVEVVLGGGPQSCDRLEGVPEVGHRRKVVGEGDAEQSFLLQDAVCFCLGSV